MTPAIDAAKRAGIEFRIHEYQHDPGAESYGEEAAQALGVDARRVFKTLLVATPAPAGLAVAMVPVDGLLNLKGAAKALGVKKTEMADQRAAERATGYVVGGISPLGQKKRLPAVLDESALAFETIYVSAGRRGLEIELSPGDLTALTGAVVAPVAASAQRRG